MSFRFKRQSLRAGLCLSALALLVAVSTAGLQAQDFSLTAAPFDPFAVPPGGNASSNITLTADSAVSVDMTCQVTSQTAGTPPICNISPGTVNVPGGAVATITSTGETTPGLYTVTMTGTGPSNTHSAQQNITVLAVSPQFTITVATAVAPTSVPAGNSAQGVININPINGYASPTGTNGQTGVTLSCATVTPLVTIPPFCSFNPPNPVVAGSVVQSTVTITSFGPNSTSAAHVRPFYALWLTLPMLALSGLGAVAGGKRSRKAWTLLAIFVACGSVLLLPACNNSSTSTTTPTGVTPNNTYTFTILGVDADGNISSNTTGTSVGPTVSMGVTTAAN